MTGVTDLAEATAGPLWNDVVGQPEAVDRLRAAIERGPVHAYLFVGPAGSTKLEAARAFAARLLGATDAGDDRTARLVQRGEHPDVHEVRRTGAAISRQQADDIIRAASLTPTEGTSKVMLLDEFHLLTPEAAARLLKTIEEPPASTTFVILADFVPHDLVTISSRCARIEFRAIDPDLIAQRLVTEGIDPDAAAAAAAAANGDIDRARVLATDPDLSVRRHAFAQVPHRLDGTGAVALGAAAELVGLIDAAAAPLAARHAAEIAELDALIKAQGERGSGKKQLDERHKRELRRHRTDELRAGLAVMAGTYRDAAVAGSIDGASCAAAVRRIHAAIEALDRNPNERLLLEALLWSLPDTRGA